MQGIADPELRNIYPGTPSPSPQTYEILNKLNGEKRERAAACGNQTIIKLK